MPSIVYIHMAAAAIVLLKVVFHLGEKTGEDRTWHLAPIALLGLTAFGVGVEPLFDQQHITLPQTAFMVATALIVWFWEDRNK